MPVRMKAVDALAAALWGPVAYNSVREEVRFGKENSWEPYEERFDPLHRAYVSMIDDIDWNRVLTEAHSRHVALDHKDPDDETDDFKSFIGIKGICPECLNEALLQKNWQDWERDPNAPREVP